MNGAIVSEDIEAAAAEPASIKISPFARRIAADLHVDVTRIRGSGSDVAYVVDRMSATHSEGDSA